LRLIIEAGYSKPTPLQKKIIPLVIKGKDLAVEAGEQTGKTAAFLLPVMNKIKKTKPGIKGLIVTGTLESSRKVYKFFQIFAQKKINRLTAFIVGEEVEAKKEYKELQKVPDILIGTSERIIDHIRRDNLTFENLQIIVIDSPAIESPDNFNLDVQFILSKIPKKNIQKLFFSPVPITGNNVSSLIKRSLIINKSDWYKNVNPPRHTCYTVNSNEKKLALLCNILLSKPRMPVFIFFAAEEISDQIKDYLDQRKIKTGKFSQSKSEAEKHKLFEQFRNKQFDVMMLNLNQELAVINFSEVGLIINFDTTNNLQKHLKNILLNTQENIEIISFFDNDINLDLKKLQEIDKLDTRQGIIPSEEEVLKGLITRIVSKIKEEENPEELHKLKKIILKNVPIFERGYFMAYLFKQNLPAQTEFNENTATGPTTRLFLNIGKNRKVFPRDIITLFCTRLNIDKAFIKEIKILDNYSFVEIETHLAEKAITAINGFDFKGRKIAINFAKKKEKSTRVFTRTRARAD